MSTTNDPSLFSHDCIYENILYYAMSEVEICVCWRTTPILASRPRPKNRYKIDRPFIIYWPKLENKSNSDIKEILD